MKRSSCVAVALAVLWLPTSAAAAPCETLAALVLTNARITAAEVVEAGTFTPPAGAGRGGGSGQAAQQYRTLPAFCRVAATLQPSGDSDIKIEVWLPVSGWNGKFQGVGNGGWAGSVPYAAMATAMAGGYATAGTDTGHSGGTAAFALGHPEKVIDMGHRAVHEMTVQAKAVVNAFYAAPPKLSIWNGCSQGGRQGITEAVRYPLDYDAIVAGAAAVNWMHLHAGRMAVNRFVNRSPGSAIPADKYALIHNAVLAACDSLDGVEDGVLENPLRCVFDASVLQCTGADSSTCLTAAQVESVKALYRAVNDPRTGAEVLPGLAAGSELGWAVAAGAQPVGTSLEAYKYVIMQDPNWDISRFNPVTDIDRALKADRDDVLGSTNPNMRQFFDRGGRLLLYHGWSDPQVAPSNTVGFFNKVVSVHGTEAVGRSIQLYMVPGMNHCQGGPGTDTFDKVAAIEQWVQTGRSPARIPASRVTGGKVERTRPLCPFGQVARWNGTGSTDDAAGFSCVADVHVLAASLRLRTRARAGDDRRAKAIGKL